MEQVEERHRQELAALHAERGREREELGTASTTASSPVPRVRWSPELLDLRRREGLLLRQRAYAEAGKVRRQAERLKARERAAARRARDAVWERREETLKAQQAAELWALREKAAAKSQGFMRQREADCRRLRQRNRNVLSLWEEKQQQQRARAASAVRRMLEAAVHRGEEGAALPGRAMAMETPMGDGGARAASAGEARGAAAAAAPAQAQPQPSLTQGVAALERGGKRSLFPRIEESGAVGESPGG